MSAQVSFVDVPIENHFPIQNLPFSAGFVRNSSNAVCVSRIGDFVIDLSVLEEEKFFISFIHRPVFHHSTLNDFMSLGRPVWQQVREVLQRLLDVNNQELQGNEHLRQQVLVPISEFRNSLPVQIGDYTDFYASKNHAYNVGCIVRGPDNALQPNWSRLPVGYHGRASSVVLSGTPVVRPKGQAKPPNADEPIYTDCKRLDFEIEMGFFIGSPVNQLGDTINVNQARDSIFGLVILNDWSARDFQVWEYVPLGPFNAKNFITTISPWIVTLEALEQFRVDLPEQEPTPLPYLNESQHYAYDINLQAKLKTPGMENFEKIAETNLKYLYWSMAQQLAHHTETGCNLRVGDLMGTGTISGTDVSSYGSMLELSWSGQNPIQLSDGSTRTFLQDGDQVELTGFSRGEGFTIGFGEVTSEIRPAIPNEYWP